MLQNPVYRPSLASRLSVRPEIISASALKLAFGDLTPYDRFAPSYRTFKRSHHEPESSPSFVSQGTPVQNIFGLAQSRYGFGWREFSG